LEHAKHERRVALGDVDSISTQLEKVKRELDNSTGDISDKLDELRKERDTALAKVADRSMQLAQTRARADELTDELEDLERDRQRATWGERKSPSSWFGQSLHDQMGSIGNSTPIAAASKLFQRSNSTDNPL
jgi:uncharacterized coiled-coil DUF342 family protein